MHLTASGLLLSGSRNSQTAIAFFRFLLADEIVRRGAARSGLTWHFCRPPVRGLEFEMDCRGVRFEEVI